jgi:O-antigen/teichoic acid export membrane protein
MIAMLITGVLLNRALGPEGRGVFAEIQTWVMLFAVALGFSMDTAIYHFANRGIYGNDYSERFRTIFTISLLYGLFAAVVLSIFMFMAPERFSSEMLRFIPILGLIVLTTILTNHLRIFIQSMEDISFSALSTIVQGIANILIIATAYFVDYLNLTIVVVTLLIIQLVPLSMFISYFYRRQLFQGQFSLKLAQRVIVAGLKQHVATVATFVYTKINQLIIFHCCGKSEAGIYAIALELTFIAIAIPGTFQTVLYPRVINANDDYEITVRSIRYGIYCWGACVLLIALFAKPLVLLYAGQNFISSVPIFRLLLISAWLLPVSSMLAPYYVKKGAFSFASFSALTLGVISICLNMLMVPSMGAKGAAVATSVSCLTGFIMVIAFLGVLSRKNPLTVFIFDSKS